MESKFDIVFDKMVQLGYQDLEIQEILNECTDEEMDLLYANILFMHNKGDVEKVLYENDTGLKLDMPVIDSDEEYKLVEKAKLQPMHYPKVYKTNDGKKILFTNKLNQIRKPVYIKGAILNKNKLNLNPFVYDSVNYWDTNGVQLFSVKAHSVADFLSVYYESMVILGDLQYQLAQKNIVQMAGTRFVIEPQFMKGVMDPISFKCSAFENLASTLNKFEQIDNDYSNWNSAVFLKTLTNMLPPRNGKGGSRLVGSKLYNMEMNKDYSIDEYIKFMKRLMNRLEYKETLAFLTSPLVANVISEYIGQELKTNIDLIFMTIDAQFRLPLDADKFVDYIAKNIEGLPNAKIYILRMYDRNIDELSNLNERLQNDNMNTWAKLIWIFAFYNCNIINTLSWNYKNKFHLFIPDFLCSAPNQKYFIRGNVVSYGLDTIQFKQLNNFKDYGSKYNFTDRIKLIMNSKFVDEVYKNHSSDIKEPKISYMSIMGPLEAISPGYQVINVF